MKNPARELFSYFVGMRYFSPFIPSSPFDHMGRIRRKTMRRVSSGNSLRRGWSKPHQSTREKQRRLRQREKGMLAF